MSNVVTESMSSISKCTSLKHNTYDVNYKLFPIQSEKNYSSEVTRNFDIDVSCIWEWKKSWAKESLLNVNSAWWVIIGLHGRCGRSVHCLWIYVNFKKSSRMKSLCIFKWISWMLWWNEFPLRWRTSRVQNYCCLLYTSRCV